MRTVSVIIPTLCTASRANLLERAIRSIINQNNASVIPLIVVNGTLFDEEIYRQFSRRQDLRLVYIENGGLPAALRCGREHVDTDFFSFLDDDDIYLPGAVDVRLEPFEDDSLDLVVTNGFRCSEGRRELFSKDMKAFEADPLHSLFEFNWLPSCGGLYRTKTMPPELFDLDIHYREWTYVAFQAALAKKIEFINTSTFEISDTPDSLSKSAQYIFAEPFVIEKLLQLPLDEDSRALLRRRLSDAFHYASVCCLEQRRLRTAWGYHFRSIRNRYGAYKYCLYTRHLITPMFRSGIRGYSAGRP